MILVHPCATRAETYVAGFGGYGLSAKLSVVRSEPGLTGSDLGLQNSPIYGLKVGYFLDNLKYFGGEVEVYTATPYSQAAALHGERFGRNGYWYYSW